MSAVLVTAGKRAWRWSALDPLPPSDRFRAVAIAVIVDDLTLEPPHVRLAVTSRTPGFSGVANADGFVGLVGRPGLQIPEFDLAGAPVAFDVAAVGFEPLALSGAFGGVAGYPANFEPADFGVRRLARRAVEIRGRVFRVVAGLAQPAAGAVVTVSAATPVQPLSGAVPLPPSASVFTVLTATADAEGLYRLPAIARAQRLQITASEGGDSLSRLVAPDYVDPVMLLDFRLA